MNYWDNLSSDLRNIILGFVVTTIQKNWRGSLQSPAKQSLTLVNELFTGNPDEMYYTFPLKDGDPLWKYMDTMSPRTALIVGYCSKYADLRIGGYVWGHFIKTIIHNLRQNEFRRSPGVIYYREIESDLSILLERLSRQTWIPSVY